MYRCNRCTALLSAPLLLLSACAPGETEYTNTDVTTAAAAPGAVDNPNDLEPSVEAASPQRPVGFFGTATFDNASWD